MAWITSSVKLDGSLSSMFLMEERDRERRYYYFSASSP
jgi:hypothetical protein